jgi:hypothetical protein
MNPAELNAIMEEITDPVLKTELTIIQDAQRIAMRDVSINGEFSNPFNRRTDSLAYKAYEAIEKHYYSDQVDLEYDIPEEKL